MKIRFIGFAAFGTFQGHATNIMDYRTRLYERYLSTHFGAVNRYAFQTDYGTLEGYFRLNYLKRLPEDKSARIVDIGCGMGQFLIFLQANGYKNHVGIDVSEEAVAYCVSHGLHAEKQHALAHLAGHPNTYDAIVMNDLIEHFTKPEMFDLVGACYEALRPNGVVLIKTVNAANPILGTHSMAMDLTHELILSEESLAQLLNVFAFQDVKVFSLNIYTKRYNPIHWLARCLSGCVNLLWRSLYTLYGRPGTRCFGKNILAVGRKPESA